MRSTLGYWLGLTLVVVAIKAGFYVWDAEIGYVLGDSASYIYSALTDWVPPDRSWVYGVLVRWATLGDTELQALAWFQMVASAANCLILAFVLTRFLACSRPVAAVAAIVCAGEPIQLLYERYVMTETFSLLGFGLFLVTLLFFLRRGSPGLLIIALTFGALAAALRLAYMPVAVVLAILACGYFVFFGSAAAASNGRLAGKLRELGSLLLITTVSLGFFMALEKAPRGASAHGEFLLAAWSPLLVEEPFASKPQLAPFISASDCPFTWQDRGDQQWKAGCLISRIVESYQKSAEQTLCDPVAAGHLAQQNANDFCGRVASELLAHFPIDVLEIGFHNWWVMWDRQALKQILLVDSGSRSIPDDFIAFMSREFGRDVRTANETTSPMRSYFRNAIGWYWWVICAPVFLLLWWLSWLGSRNPAPLLIAAAASVLVVVITIPVSEPSIRLYHGIAWLSLIGLASLVDRALRWQRGGSD